ncbi:WD repeat-containing protein 76 [Amphiprion ocellaris]|uniref:WD repeat-containing protein 76 n=1 Tax=Amphiprion ocellaris TaxID=80972 RepID=A0A3Q1C6I5_AMPOC|nr:WD repeat-containing protein 76 [Amphiprion ocellaris]XP_023153359.3 WD repeat-containing protein 76 [Amphiprion ocellaris]XP_023153360.3 WD repeat-containing protein 76 [Amphiprion ocellaris]XP_035798511.2 WD repeat-containing protein 76 [Amphiprion ocellaris]
MTLRFSSHKHRSCFNVRCISLNLLTSFERIFTIIIASTPIMATRRVKREAVVEEMTPVNLEETSRRSSRTALAPKRLQYSPGDSTAKTAQKKRKTKTLVEEVGQNERLTKDEEDVENSDVDLASDGHGGLSAYELERLENIRQNQAFLSSINLFQATEEFKQLTKPKASQRGLMRSQAAVKQVLPPRKSLRLQNKEAEVLTLPAEPRGTLIFEETTRIKKPPGPLSMEPINMEGNKLPSQLLKLCSEDSTEDRKNKLDLKEYRSALKKMQITEDKVAKVVKDRIFSAAFHPCTSSLLMATGDKWGKVGLWKLGSDWGDDGVLLFEPHTRPVGCMAFSSAHPTQLLSLSYDGSLRCMDIERAVFDDVYDIEDGLKTFDFMSHDCSTLVVGNWYGEVAIVDRRSPGNSHESLHTVDAKAVRCVSVHPLQKQYFAVAESKVVSIYDSRCLKKTKSQAVSQLLGHSLSISSAYFSPCTGNRVLTSCMDNYIRVYDTSAMTTKSPLLTLIRHDMHTGRWLTKLSAVWDPKQEDCFVVGSMMRPRRVQVFHESGQLEHTFMDNENLSTVLSVTAFHPTRNALLGGNASGRLHVFSS